MILATLGTSMVKVLVVTRCHAQYGAVHNHRDLCDTPLDTGVKPSFFARHLAAVELARS